MSSSNHSSAEVQGLHAKLVVAANTFQDHRNDPIEVVDSQPLPPLTGEQIVAYAGFVAEVGKVIKARLGLGSN